MCKNNSCCRTAIKAVDVFNTSITFSTKKEEKEIRVHKTKEILINGEKRITTILAIRGKDGKLNAGYSIIHPEDIENIDKELSKKIAEGRANNPRTNLYNGDNSLTILGNVHRSVIVFMVDQLFSELEKGKIKIKGVRKNRTTPAVKID